ncbi:MAG: lysophospholipid acyltransferase family protein [Burkholderiales bacterium]|nr:lysophospholipid acyltransferase family protein [Phycisphaerae bacterium]
MNSGTQLMARVRKNRLFNLDPINGKMPMGALVKRPLERLLALPGINGIYDRVTAHAVTASEFCEKCLEDMDVSVRISKEDMDRIPRTGPLVVVANHPFGGVEGLILASVLLKVRPDFKVMVNYLLGLIPEMRPICVFVDPFGSNVQQNIKGLKQCMQLLRGGGCLGVFPSGTVSHLNLSTRTVEDPKWSQHIGGLINRTGATVLPVYFEGRNDSVFQIAGLISPRLRTALIPRATLKQRHATCQVHIGRVISARELSSFKTDQNTADFLRNRTYALAGRCGERVPLWRQWIAAMGLKRPVKHAAIAQPVDPYRLERELSTLAPEQLLAQTGDLRCYIATARQAPGTMQEVGRLRELTFRAIGEGTGRPLDLDDFDKTYHHLLVWNSAKRELVGGYRLGLVDELTARAGNAGLYVHTLFDFPPEFLTRLGPAIELGRSFVRTEYQRSFSPLMLLWKGIGAFVCRNPKYRFLFGPVSISNAYSPLSRALINDFMARPENAHDLAGMVRSRTPLKVSKPVQQRVSLLSQAIREFDDLNELVSDLEPDGKASPILLKQYTKLGAKSLGSNVDPDFGQCLDCLCILDLVNANQRSIQRYMGKEQVATYMAAHGRAPVALEHARV